METLRRYLDATREPAGAAAAVLPLVLLYGLGLPSASPQARSGVDVVSDPLLLHLGLRGYLAVQIGLALAVAGFVIARLRAGAFRRALLVGPVAVEAGAYGLVLGSLILLVMERHHLLALLPALDAVLDATTFDHLVLAAGAGLHEEVVFRLLLLPALVLLFERPLAMPRPLALAASAVVSSFAFSAAHHLAGEPFEAFAFTYRTLAGLAFAGLFLARGFAVAAWTHALYDLQLLVGR